MYQTNTEYSHAEYYYNLMWHIDPIMMFDLETLIDTGRLKNAEELFSAAMCMENNSENHVKLFWVAMAIPHIVDTNIETE